jgi:hypothetical protein
MIGGVMQLEDPKEDQEVYQLNVQLFPLTDS